MIFYIKVENGNPVNHPSSEENLLQVFGTVPSNYELFERVQAPLFGDEIDENKYKILASETPSYEKVDGVWKDVWVVRDMSDDEKADKDEYLESMAFPPEMLVSTP
jgi:hypothetical protein